MTVLSSDVSGVSSSALPSTLYVHLLGNFIHSQTFKFTSKLMPPNPA